MRSVFVCLCIVGGLILAPMAHAGSDGQPADVFSLREAADFSKHIERELAARGAFVALVFRSGRDHGDLPDGIDYTHGALWVYTVIPTADGNSQFGYAVYNLYHDVEDPTQSYLMQDFPLDFTRADATGQVGVIVPLPDLQDRIIDVMASPAYFDLHQPAYSLISNPEDLRFQNSHEFLLDIVSAAAWETTDRDQIKVNIHEYFERATIEMGFFERLAAEWLDPRMRFDDQSGAIRTTSFNGIVEFLHRYDQVQDVFELQSPHMAGGGSEGTPRGSD
jgi:hypothetical protein